MRSTNRHDGASERRSGTWHSTDFAGYLFEDQRRRWNSDQRKFVEDYLQLYPHLADNKEDLLDLIYNEICLHDECDEKELRSTFRRRFPHFSDEIDCLLDVHAVINVDDFSADKDAVDGWAGRRIAQYEILRFLGSGAMGRVFLARDAALDREVALKVLPNRFTAAMRRRLRKEAETSANLQHPCIATFYEAGESNGQTFIAMEYVPGKTLRDVLNDGQLTFEPIILILTCVLEALSHAHSLDILHRDIKPENIMVAKDSRAKLLDFGIAQRQSLQTQMKSAKEQDQLSMIVGTPGYIAPEQIHGELLSESSDLFAVGAVLFEMLTGKRAFEGSTINERIQSTLTTDVGDRLVGFPKRLREIVVRCLASDPAQRFSSTTGFLLAVRELPVQTNTNRRRSIAVLPLDIAPNLPAWFGLAIQEGVSRDLRRHPEFSVVPEERVSYMKRFISTTDPVLIGNALASDYVVTGSLRPIGETLQLTVQLTEVAMGQVIAADEFSAVKDQVADMQQMVSLFLCSQLDEPRIGENEGVERKSYEYYARGRQFWLTSEKGALNKAIQMFQKCIEVSPHHSSGLTGLATAHAMRYIFTTNADDLRQAEAFARRAIRQDATNSSAYTWLGYALGHQGEHVESFRQQLKAIDCDPSNYMAYYFGVFPFVVSHTLHSARELQETFAGDTHQDPHLWRRQQALELTRHALKINPRHGWSWLSLGNLLMELGQFREAESAFQRAIELEKTTKQNATSGAEGYLGECKRRSGDLERAKIHCMDGLRSLEQSDNVYRDTFRGVFLCSLGRVSNAQEDQAAARAAFNQAVQHLQGRSNARAAGHPMVQALAGQAHLERNSALLHEAIRLYRNQLRFDFSFMWCCTNDVTLLDLVHSASILGETQLADSLLTEAGDAGASASTALPNSAKNTH